MIIRAQQMAVMDRYADRAFEREMVQHVHEFVPARAKRAGQGGVRAFVDSGISKARKRGFSGRGPLRLYLDLMLLFGSDFDSDPQYPWALDVLDGPTMHSEMERAIVLYDRAMEALDQIAGPSRDLL